MPCGDWLLRFAISLAWRTTVISADEFRQESPELAPYVDRALHSWKTFLLREHQRWGAYAHHLFFLDDIAPSSTMPVPEKTYWYLLRGVDATIVSSDTEVFAYTKLPGIVFWSGIQPRKPRGWENTRIWQAGITMPAIHRIEQNGFWEFLLSRVKYIAEADLSEQQQNLLQQALQKDPERAQLALRARVLHRTGLENTATAALTDHAEKLASSASAT